MTMKKQEVKTIYSPENYTTRIPSVFWKEIEESALSFANRYSEKFSGKRDSSKKKAYNSALQHYLDFGAFLWLRLWGLSTNPKSFEFNHIFCGSFQRIGGKIYSLLMNDFIERQIICENSHYMPSSLRKNEEGIVVGKHGFAKSYQIHSQMQKKIHDASQTFMMQFDEVKISECVRKELQILSKDEVLNAYEGIGILSGMNPLDDDEIAHRISPMIIKKPKSLVEEEEAALPVLEIKKAKTLEKREIKRRFSSLDAFETYSPIHLYSRLTLDYDGILNECGNDKTYAGHIAGKIKRGLSKEANMSNWRIYHAFHQIPKNFREAGFLLYGEHLKEAFDVTGADLHFICKIMEKDPQFNEILHPEWYDELIRFEEAVKIDFRRGFGIVKKTGKCLSRTKMAFKLLFNFKCQWKPESDDLDEVIQKAYKQKDSDRPLRAFQRCFPKSAMMQSVCQFMRSRFPRIFLWLSANRSGLWQKMNKIEFSLMSNKMCAKLWELGIDALTVHDAIYLRESDVKRAPDLTKLFYECIDLKCDEENLQRMSLDDLFSQSLLEDIVNSQEDFRAQDVPFIVNCFAFLTENKTKHEIKEIQRRMNDFQTNFKWSGRKKRWTGNEIASHLSGKTQFDLSLSIIESQEKFLACKHAFNTSQRIIKWEDLYTLADWENDEKTTDEKSYALDFLVDDPLLFKCLSARIQLSNEASFRHCPWEASER